MITTSIVVYNTDHNEIELLLDSILRSPIDKVYIVDNSHEDLLRKFELVSPKIEYLFGHGNIGYGAAHNIAIRKSIQSGANYHIVVNPDIYFEQGIIESLEAYMIDNKSVGLIMPRIHSPEGELQYLCKLLPTPLDLIGRRFLPFKSYVERRNHYYEMRESDYNTIMEVPFLSGCFMFFRVEALVKTGGFSDRYFMYCEDIDLCRRVAESFKTVYYPHCTVVHAHKKESFISRKMLLEHIKSANAYFNYWGWIFDAKRRQVNRVARQQYSR